MSRTLRRGAVAALILATAPILAACAAGDNAATLQVKPDSAATSISTGNANLKLNGIVVVTGALGNAPANVTVNIANTDTTNSDTLTGVSVDQTPAVLSGPVSIAPLSSVLLSGPGQVSATVPTLTEQPGQNATVTFTFANAGSVTVQALVTAGRGQYAAYAPALPKPTPVATLPALPTPSGKATKPAAGASATPSKTP